jgi:hypothetical protein
MEWLLPWWAKEDNIGDKKSSGCDWGAQQHPEIVRRPCDLKGA